MQRERALPAAAGRSETFIFAKEENVNESLPAYTILRLATTPQSACSADSPLYTKGPSYGEKILDVTCYFPRLISTIVIKTRAVVQS